MKYCIKVEFVICRTVAVDLRGFGDSEKPTGVNQYKLKYLVSDLRNLIDALGAYIESYIQFWSCNR